MQIHELTQRRRVDEGLMDTIKSVGQKAASAFNDPSKMGLGSNAAHGTAQADKQLQAATKNFASRLAAEWVQQGAQLVAAEKATAAAQPPAQQKTQPAVPAGVKMPKVAPAATVSSPKPGAPTPAEQQKFQQKLQAAMAKPPVAEAFNDLPGSTPAVGGAVRPEVTAPLPKYAADKAQKQQQQKIAGGQQSSRYAKTFEKWVNQKLTTRDSTTGQTITMPEVLKRIPALGAQLKTALTSVYTTRNDPAKNQAAVENYLTLAATGFQQASAQIRKENPDAVAKSVTSTSKKRVAADPQTERVMQAIGMADSGLDTLADIVKNKGEQVTNKTGSNTIDRLLTAAGLIQ